jgi:hypothetical protein
LACLEQVLEAAQMLMWLLACLNLQLVEPAWRLLGSAWALLAYLLPAEGTHQNESMQTPTTISLK